MASTRLRLPPLPALRDFIHLYKLRAKKVLSQNFLMDMNLTRKIVLKAGIGKGDWVCEVGPGPGGITRAILEQDVSRCHVIEIDQRMIPALQHIADAAEGRLEILRADVLSTDIGSMWQNAGFTDAKEWLDDPPKAHIVGNLPFNIASPLVIKDMSYRRGAWSFGRVPLTLTFQAEVARRIVAPIGSPDRSRLSIMTQSFAEASLLFTIPGACFVPPPKIDVGVVRFVPRCKPVGSTPFEILEKLVRQVFHYRRKHVIKGLKTLYPEDNANDLAHEVLRDARVDPHTTSTKLSVEQFMDMARIYEAQCEKIPALFAYDYTRPKFNLEKLRELGRTNLPRLPAFPDSSIRS